MTRSTVLHLAKIAGISGAETHLLSLLPRLRERGWEVRLLQLHEDEPGAHDFATALRKHGVPVDMIRLRADIDPVAFARVTGYLTRARPLILHTHLVHADVYGQLAGALAAVPLRMSTKHGFNEFRENRGFAVADRAVGGLAHVHIAISRGLARYLADVEGFDETDFAIVHYGIVPGTDPEPGPAEPRFLCIGRLIPIKGHVVLLRALALALEEAPELTLEIAGRGPLEPALRALAKELGVEHAVRFLGYVAPIQRAIDDSAVVVVPSLGEGFGMVALEAMERARPVLAAEIGGLGELVVDGETGLLVPPGEAEPLARALVALARDPARRRAMGEAGRRRALEHFAEHRNVERTELLYVASLPRRARNHSHAATNESPAGIISKKSNGTR
ncbi:MAG TPA: glycosyltransferase family 4 protein [Myxococcota bacterium]|nr:glycosyltransferase family 4 protein [Myxococcota bacterium]